LREHDERGTGEHRRVPGRESGAPEETKQRQNTDQDLVPPGDL
jgi:hypothetical protein